MARYQAGPPPLPLGPPAPHAFWQAPAGPSHTVGYSQAPQPAGGHMGQQLGPPPLAPPPLGPPPLQLAPAADGRLRSVDELPPCFRGVFTFRYFNAIQNECWSDIYEAGHNVVIAAPTGGGGCCSFHKRLALTDNSDASTRFLLTAALQARRCCWSWPSCACCRATLPPVAGSGRTSPAT